MLFLQFAISAGNTAAALIVGVAMFFSRDAIDWAWARIQNARAVRAKLP
jgi:hypothetical protein